MVVVPDVSTVEIDVMTAARNWSHELVSAVCDMVSKVSSCGCGTDVCSPNVN